MKHRWISLVAAGTVGLALFSGCSPRKQITEHDRKEAAHLISEAQFALNLREWARAEGLLAKAVTIVPEGDYWLSLGGARMHLNNRSGAKEAYLAALKAYEFAAARHNKIPEPWLKQAFVLGLLGRKDDGRAVIEKAAKAFPNDPKVRALTDPKEFERMFSAPSVKEVTL